MSSTCEHYTSCVVSVSIIPFYVPLSSQVYSGTRRRVKRQITVFYSTSPRRIPYLYSRLYPFSAGVLKRQTSVSAYSAQSSGAVLTSSGHERDMFVLIVSPVVAALRVVFDATADASVLRRIVRAFVDCASLADFYAQEEVLGDIVTALAEAALRDMNTLLSECSGGYFNFGAAAEAPSNFNLDAVLALRNAARSVTDGYVMGVVQAERRAHGEAAAAAAAAGGVAGGGGGSRSRSSSISALNHRPPHTAQAVSLHAAAAGGNAAAHHNDRSSGSSRSGARSSSAVSSSDVTTLRSHADYASHHHNHRQLQLASAMPLPDRHPHRYHSHGRSNSSSGGNMNASDRPNNTSNFNFRHSSNGNRTRPSSSPEGRGHAAHAHARDTDPVGADGSSDHESEEGDAANGTDSSDDTTPTARLASVTYIACPRA